MNTLYYQSFRIAEPELLQSNNYIIIIKKKKLVHYSIFGSTVKRMDSIKYYIPISLNINFIM